MLAEKGAVIQFDDSELPLFSVEDTKVVYTPAIGLDQTVVTHFLNSGFELFKRSEILGEISKGTYCMAVAGTHGKTTTSSILAHLMVSSNSGAYAFLGGITTNYGSNYIEGDSPVSVVEADEYDRSFLRLRPSIACITSTDEDHLDIYKDKWSFLESFQEFSELVSGVVIYRKGTGLSIESGYSYGFENEDVDIAICDVRVVEGSYRFGLKSPLGDIEDLCFSLAGNHNLLNAIAAISMAQYYGVSSENIKNGLRTFKGIERRFSMRIQTRDLILIDDYAHHPTEIDALVEAVRTFYPSQKITGVFQPHLFSRTKDFMDEFAKSLSQFDFLGLLPIYPARELPITGINSEVLERKISGENTTVIDASSFSSYLDQRETKVVVCFGAGDIGKMIKGYCDEKGF